MNRDDIRPFNIIYKQELNNIIKSILLSRQSMMKNNNYLDIIQATKLVLLMCLAYKRFRSTLLFECKHMDEIVNFFSTDAIGDDSWIYDLIGISSETFVNLNILESLEYVKEVFSFEHSDSLFIYAMEILEYTDDDIDKANKVKGGGIVTKKKKKKGIYYTPEDVAYYMTKVAIDKLLEIKGDLSDVCCVDFSCGSGIFLRELLVHLHVENMKYGYENCESVLETSLYGADISELAVVCARFTILMTVSDMYTNSLINYSKLVVILNKNIVQLDGRRPFEYPTTIPRKFDCIIGNPPYVRERTKAGLDSNIYIDFVKNLIRYSKDESVCSLIVPLSITYSSLTAFKDLRGDIGADKACWIFENYDRSPDSIFGDDVKSRNTILFRIRDCENQNLMSTKMYRWTSKSREHFLLSNKRYGKVDRKNIKEYIPKVGSELEVHTYDRVQSYEKSLMSCIGRTMDHKYTFYVKSTCYNWICAYDQVPSVQDENGLEVFNSSYKAYSVMNEQELYFAIAVLNSKFSYWLWTVIGDGFHVTNRLLRECRIHPSMVNKIQYDEMSHLGRQMNEEMKKKPVISYNAGRVITTYSPAGLEGLVERIDSIIINSMKIKDDFLPFLKTWYEEHISCSR